MNAAACKKSQPSKGRKSSHSSSCSALILSEEKSNFLKKELQNKIEELRLELNQIAEKHGDLVAPEVLEISQRLDALIVLYQRTYKKSGS